MSEEKTPASQAAGFQHRIDLRVISTVVKITAPATRHSPPAIGTGFVVSREGSWRGRQHRLMFLVTNKHMIGDWTIADGDILEYRPSLQVAFYGGPGGAFTPVNVDLDPTPGAKDPSRVRLASDPKVDIAAVFLNEVPGPAGIPLSVNSLDTSYLQPFSKIPNVFTGLGDQVFALGYPLGIASTTTSHPIAKAGYLAAVPGNEFALDMPSTGRNSTGTTIHLEGKLLVVDGLIVPGNSGGPIVLASDLKMRREPATGQLQFATKQAQNLVIGIVSMAIGASGLTLAYSSDYILELIDAFSNDLGRAPSETPVARPPRAPAEDSQ